MFDGFDHTQYKERSSSDGARTLRDARRLVARMTEPRRRLEARRKQLGQAWIETAEREI